MTHLDYLLQQVEIIKEKFRYSFINKVISPTKNDFILYFSKNKDFGLFCSINNNAPFVNVCNTRISSTIQSPFLNKMKSKLLGAFLEDAEILNNDNILCLSFVKTTDTYDRIRIKMIFEIFKANSNLIFIEDEAISDALRIKSLETKHPTIVGLKYLPPDKIGESKELTKNELFGFHNYVANIENKYLNEKYATVTASLKRKRKTIINKITKLVQEKNDATKNLVYKEYGDILLSFVDEIHKGQEVFEYEDYKIPLKPDYSPIQNSQFYYKQYKKSKTALDLVDKYIDESNETLNYIDEILNSVNFYNEDDYIELITELEKNKMIKIRVKTAIKKGKTVSNPYYFFKNGVRIGFGKNAKQNNKLTFEFANKNCYYAHIKDDHGPHVVIFDDNPSDEVIQTACELALALANKKDGDVLFTPIKYIKKTSTLGLVNVLKYETYHINKFLTDVFTLIKNASRF